MSGLRSGAIILLLAVPFGLYVAWQVQGVSRVDLIVPDPPSEKGFPGKEQLAATRAKTDRWAGDVQKAAAVAFQFRPHSADDAASDEDCNALAKAAAARAADLTDLERFLSGVERPEYTGSLRPRYQEWQASKAQLAKAEKAVEEWFTNPLPGVDNPEAAAKALGDSGFAALVREYEKDRRFSDPTKAAGWRVRARARVIDLLADAARDPFEKVVNLKLPLPAESESADVRKALGAPRAIAEQAKLLREQQAQIAEAKVALPARVTAEADEALKRAADWAARSQWLALFAEPELFTRPDGAADWLTKVQAQLDKTASNDDRTRLRDKVQEFCDAFIPKVVALDEFVLLDGKKVARGAVSVKYFPQAGGTSERAKLTADVNGLNEFNVAERYPGENTLITDGAAEYTPKQLQPTALSRAAVDYALARTEVGTGTGAPKWSAKSVEELKNKCKAIAGEVNQLKVPGGKPDTPRIWDRLESLSRGAAACGPLFERQ
jgi:hypothetical protein